MLCSLEFIYNFLRHSVKGNSCSHVYCLEELWIWSDERVEEMRSRWVANEEPGWFNWRTCFALLVMWWRIAELWRCLTLYGGHYRHLTVVGRTGCSRGWWQVGVEEVLNMIGYNWSIEGGLACHYRQQNNQRWTTVYRSSVREHGNQNAGKIASWSPSFTHYGKRAGWSTRKHLWAITLSRDVLTTLTVINSRCRSM